MGFFNNEYQILKWDDFKERHHKVFNHELQLKLLEYIR